MRAVRGETWVGINFAARDEAICLEAAGYKQSDLKVKRLGEGKCVQIDSRVQELAGDKNKALSPQVKSKCLGVGGGQGTGANKDMGLCGTLDKLGHQLAHGFVAHAVPDHAA